MFSNSKNSFVLLCSSYLMNSCCSVHSQFLLRIYFVYGLERSFWIFYGFKVNYEQEVKDITIIRLSCWNGIFISTIILIIFAWKGLYYLLNIYCSRYIIFVVDLNIYCSRYIGTKFHVVESRFQCKFANFPIFPPSFLGYTVLVAHALFVLR